MQCKGATGLSTDPLCFSLQIIERAYENKNRCGFIDRQRKGASLAHSQGLEARIKVFRGSNDYRIIISSLILGFFNYWRVSFWSKNENLPMTSELSRQIESFSGIQTHASLQWETRASVVTLVIQAAGPSLLEMTTYQHFARSRLTASGNQRYKRVIYADV